MAEIEHTVENDARSRCDVVGAGKPVVWKDDYGWNCDQTTECRTCRAVSSDRLAEDATWVEALQASRGARVIPPAVGEAL